MRHSFQQLGWVRLPWAKDVAEWAEAALSVAQAAVRAPENAAQLQCEGTWFVGVDALPNDITGAVAGVRFPQSLTDTIKRLALPDLPLHRAQVSVMYPGYPRPRAGESEAGFRYRKNRDAAHLDGLLPVGPKRCRMIQEPHAYILGLPLTDASPDAAPLVLWEGSHLRLAAALRARLAGMAGEELGQVDVTGTYQAARRDVFAACRRVAVTARSGEAYLLHRHLLHGVAPWGDAAKAGPDGRMIAYFRPERVDGVAGWLAAP